MTEFASTSKVQLAYQEEAAYGVVPASGTPQYLRATGSTLAFDYTMTTSKEINATAQTPDSVITDATAGGAVPIELSYATYDDFIESLLRSTFTVDDATLTVGIDHTAGTITDAGTDGFADAFVAGQWFYMSGANVGTGNAGLYRIASRTDDVLTVDASTPLTTTVASAASTLISSSRISNGVDALRSFCIEQSHTDVTQFFMNTGRIPSKIDLTFAPGQILTGSIEFMGATQTRAAATGFNTTPAAPTSYGIMNCVTGVGNLLVRNAAGSSILDGATIMQMSISIDGKLRGQKAIATLGNAGVGQGTFAMTGSMSIYFAGGTLYDLALAGNLATVMFSAQDSSHNGYVFNFANVKCNVPKVPAAQMDQDVMLDVTFTAVAPNTSTDRMISIDRFGVSLA